VIYSAWGRDDGDGYEFLFIPGHELPPEHAGQSPGLTLLKVFEADSWDDAARQYYEWQGWEPYKPMGDSPADHQP
jgi:hypothetical protein